MQESVDEGASTQRRCKHRFRNSVSKRETLARNHRPSRIRARGRRAPDRDLLQHARRRGAVRLLDEQRGARAARAPRDVRAPLLHLGPLGVRGRLRRRCARAVHAPDCQSWLGNPLNLGTIL